VTLCGHEMMIRNNNSTDKELKVYPGGFHNLLQEPALKTTVKADIQKWILDRS
jgi:alpha-beta hydrolase superfamily lysophospholipase